MSSKNYLKTHYFLLSLAFTCLLLQFINENLNALSIAPNTPYTPNNQYNPNTPYNPNPYNPNNPYSPNNPYNPNNPNNPSSPYNPTNAGPLIIDMMLASPDDDPEPYIIEYIQGKEKVQVRKIRVLGAPDTSTIFFTAYQTFINQQCRNLWLVRISLSDNMAQGYARVVSCDQALKENILKTENKRTVLNYSSLAWPK